MARKAEPGISYYRMNCGHTRNKKVRLVVNEFDSDGYWIWQCILDVAYATKGYYFDYNDKDSLELFATDVCKKRVSLVEEVIAGCVRRDLFDKAVFDMFGVLSSEMMQEVYVDATKERRKKGTVIELKEDYLLIEIPNNEVNISIIPGKKVIPPGRNSDVPGNNPQSIVEKSIVEKSISVTAQPPPAKKGGRKKKEEIPEPYWQQLVDTWFEFVKEKFKEAPLFAGQDPKFFKSIIGKLKKRAAAKRIEWTQEAAVGRLKLFLNYAFANKWLADHFLLKNLDSQFEQIGRDTQQISNQVKNHVADPQTELQQLYERLQHDHPRTLVITPAHMDFLSHKGLLKINDGHLKQAVHKRMENLTGSNQHKDLQLLKAYQKNGFPVSKDDPEFKKVLARIVVLEYFYELEQQNVKSIFDE